MLAIGKDQVHRILEAFAMFKLPGHLLLLDAVQDIHDLPGGLQLSGFPVLGRDENALSIAFSGPLKLLVDSSSCFEGDLHRISEPVSSIFARQPFGCGRQCTQQRQRRKVHTIICKTVKPMKIIS